MRIFICVLLALGVLATAEERVKRQATYTFPGPRTEVSARQAPSYRAQQQQQQQPRPSRVFEEPDDSNLYEPAPRRSNSYQPAQPRSPPPQPVQSAPVYEAPRPAPAPQPRQSYSPPPASSPRKRASASSRANKYGGSAPQQSLNGGVDEEEEEQGPDALTLLLEDSKFSCGGKNDGYYADDSVNCQVFHYCVSGARHSWMCPEGTVFHQVHLNCVPDSQDICSQSQKFHFVNDYLYKPLDYDGPNNTARYAQRYYPDGYVVGDPLVSTHDAPSRPQSPPPQQPPPSYSRPQAPQQAPPSYSRQQVPQQAPPSYSRPQTRVQSYPQPAPRQQAQQPPRQLAPPPPPPPPSQQPPTYSVPAQPSGYSPAAPPRSSRPSRPAQTYSAEVPQGYRRSPRIEPPPHSVPVEDDDDESSYQPAPETRRYAPPATPRSSSGYAAPRQYRPAASRSAAAPAAAPVRAQYPSYASNQAAGVQYDEDY